MALSDKALLIQLIMTNADLKKSYQYMIDWYLYRLDQNKESLDKLITLMSKLSSADDGDSVYQEDFEDLGSLKIIYETAIRNFEGKLSKYKVLLEDE